MRATVNIHLALTTIGTACIAVSAPTAAQSPMTPYDLPAQPIATSLRAVALKAGVSIVADADIVAGKLAPSLSGRHSVEEAVTLLLRGSGLTWSKVGTAIVVERGDQQPKTMGTAATPGDSDIVVTGSRIRGAAPASSVIVLGRDAARDAGKTTVADVVGSLPQNFGGGQNPGIGFNVPATSGADVGGGSGVNLRGLGSDATLTLLNGHRLPYNGPVQSVDISAIPLGAIDRIEVVPDGASALFGSDAIAGVVNVILRRGFSGLETSAKLGTTTEGGYDVRQFDATVGRQWGSGGIVVAYQHADNSAIQSGQRDFAVGRPGLTLYPALNRNSALLTGRQVLAPGVTLSVDGLYNRRSTDLTYPLNPAGDLSVSRARSFSDTEAYTIAPSLTFDLPGDWQASLFGSAGTDRVDYGGDLFFGTRQQSGGSGFYRNRSRMAELSGDGALFDLPGGTAKLAIGTGYRRYAFQRVAGSVAADADRAQDSYFAFSELNLPLFGGVRKLRYVERLSLSIAGRYERYPGIADVVTPKVGLVYAPLPNVEVRGTWGRSFRAPTLYQQYQPQGAYLTTATSLGASGLPAGSAALLLLGGNPSLKPERSENWSATLAIKPRLLPGLDLELSYFSVRYTDRIVTPILFTSTALRDPALAAYVTSSPSAADQAAVIAGSATFVNISGVTYDPSRVVAIIRNTSVNAGRQTVGGFDLLARYRRSIGQDTLGMTVNASYLDSHRQISATQPVTQLSGVLFNPAKFRARADLSWSNGPVTLTTNVNYIGPVRDTRTATALRVDGTLPIDFTARFRSGEGAGLLRGLDVIVSAQNIFNDQPTTIATTLFYDAPYDSTNYSPIGRTVSVSVLKKW